MYRLESGLFLLLLTASIWSTLSSEPLIVKLQPETINVCEGALVQLNCTWDPPQKVEDSNTSDKVKWYFNKSHSGNQCDSINILKNASFFDKTYTWSVLKKSFISPEESGWYFCQVIRDIPTLQENCSNEVQVVVEANSTKDPQRRNSTSDLNQTSSAGKTSPSQSTICTTQSPNSSDDHVFKHWWLWVAVAVGCIILITSVVALSLCSCRTKEVVYENTQPKKSGLMRRERNQRDGGNLPMSKQVDTIKPLRKYDTIPQNKIR